MPVPSLITDLSETPASNSPQGSESVGPNMNAYIQAAYAFIRQMYDGQLKPTAAVNFNGQKLTGLANGSNPTDAMTFGQIGAVMGAFGGPITLVDTATSTKKTLRCISNIFQVLNNAGNVALISSDDAGNFTAAGNVTAYSDERLKTDWVALDNGFVDRLATEVKSGSYTRVDSGQRHVGVSAQDIQNLLPEAVQSDYRGILSLAYGQAAMVSVVELAKEVVALRKRVEELENKP